MHFECTPYGLGTCTRDVCHPKQIVAENLCHWDEAKGRKLVQTAGDVIGEPTQCNAGKKSEEDQSEEKLLVFTHFARLSCMSNLL